MESRQFEGVSCKAVVLCVIEPELGSSSGQKINAIFAQLVDIAHATPASKLILDVSSVVYFGAAFVNALVRLVKRVRANGQQLVVCGDQLDLLKLCRLDLLFPVAADVSRAVC